MSAVGWGSKADLEAEIEGLENQIWEHEQTLERIHKLLGSAFVGSTGDALIKRDTWTKILEELE